MTIEDRLRKALREDAPQPLDGPAIAAAGRRRRTVTRVRIGAAAAAVVLIGGFGWQVVGGSMTVDQGASSAPAPQSGAAEAAPSAPQARQTDASRPGDAEPGLVYVVPGRDLRILADRWCLVDSGDGREVTCAENTQRTQRVTDSGGGEWLVVLVPAAPGTAALEVQQDAGWVRLQTIPAAADRLLGVAPGTLVPQAPRGLRGLDDQGHLIWQESV